jgi:predicted Rdx family selenoprotein
MMGITCRTFLEQLVAEWYEFQHYYVRRNVKVSKRLLGGFDSELDVVAFNPGIGRLVHIEASMDAHSWDKREVRFKAKFAAGRKHIPSLFKGLKLPKIEQIALLGAKGASGRREVGGGRVQSIANLMNEIRIDLMRRPVNKDVIPEQYVILRGLQFATSYWPAAK